MTRTNFLLFFLLTLCSLKSAAQQMISGRVVSSETGKPVAGASVFISNTSKGTITDEKGNFVLYNIPVGRYIMVISYIGFQSDFETLDSRYPKTTFDVTLKVKATELGEVKVQVFDANGYKKWGELFREEFVGTSDFARKCKILNPEVIKIHYAPKSRILSAYSDGPIIIENPSLGYELQVTMDFFRLVMASGETSFSYFPLFKQMKGTPKQEKRWEANRATSYYGSSLHFFRALYQNRVREEGFFMWMESFQDSTSIQNIKGRIRNAWIAAKGQAGPEGERASPEALLDRNFLEQYDRMLDGAHEGKTFEYPGMVSVDQIVPLRDSNVTVMDFDLVLKVRYLNAKVPDRYISDVVVDPQRPESMRKVPVTRAAIDGMTTELELMRGFPVDVFPNGSYLNSDLMFRGYWSWSQKMGNLLPYDYTPPPKAPSSGPPYD
jgi:hypothetical protein